MGREEEQVQNARDMAASLEQKVTAKISDESSLKLKISDIRPVD